MTLGRRLRVTGHERTVLAEGWQLASGAEWIPARVPTTAAAALRAAGRWSFDAAPPVRFDGAEWTWRTRVRGAPTAPGEETVLCLDGIATVADVLWNGECLLKSDDMFVAHEARVTLTGDDELVLRCHALDPLLAAKRPRPRWRAPMIEHQQLRWHRTTLLGRTPGWSPPAPPVGPWR